MSMELEADFHPAGGKVKAIRDFRLICRGFFQACNR